MSEDVNKLLERLRTYYGDDLACRILLMDARHALEAMAGEVERLTVAAKAADMFHAINGHGIKQAEELADHIIRQMLWGIRIDDSNKGIVRGYLLDHFKAVISRAEAAEAERDRTRADYEAMKAHNKELFGKLSAAELERDRLKAALQAIEQGDYYGCVSEFALKALGGDAS